MRFGQRSRCKVSAFDSLYTSKKQRLDFCPIPCFGSCNVGPYAFQPVYFTGVNSHCSVVVSFEGGGGALCFTTVLVPYFTCPFALYVYSVRQLVHKQKAAVVWPSNSQFWFWELRSLCD